MPSRLPLLISALFFLAGLGWFSRGLEFPPYYHPDEIHKVIQIQDNYRNFNHPQLMLNAGSILYKLAGSPESKLRTAAITRWVSVIFSAATVALMAYAAYLLAGPVAQICCGWLVLTQPKVFEFAHYLKEDPALTMGFAVIYVTLILFVRQPTASRAAWLGAASALAVSGKYVGIYPAMLALIGVIWASTDKKKNAAVFLGVFLLGVAAINWQALVDHGQFQQGLGREVSLFEEKAVSLLNPKIIDAVTKEIGFFSWLGLAAWLASPLYRKRRLTPAEWIILVATFGYALMLITSSRAASRYLLPVTVSLPLIVSVAACWIGAWLAGLLRKPSPLFQSALCLPLVIGSGIQDFTGLQKQLIGFHNDTRLELRDYIAESIPPDALIAEDDPVKLPNAETPRRSLDSGNLPNPRLYARDNPRLADEYTPASLNAKGVRYVVLQMDNFMEDVLAGKEREPKPNQKKMKAFLTELEDNADLMWSCDSHSPVYLNPALRLYRLRPGPGLEH